MKNNKYDNLIVFDNDDYNFEKEDENLQENFKKFLKLRNEMRKPYKSINQKDLDDPKRKSELRTKFIEQAKKYLGVPYSKHYISKDNPLYNSPLFLDCCGLIRRIIADLEDEFGFRLGRWNQNYQFDTLPIKLEFNEMKPGDIIFYEATYYPEENMKPQVHGLVHCEIFLGGISGEQTIAARDCDGVVDFFDSYKFEAGNYYNIKYHYRSIDTWLSGTLKSYCQEHEWKDELLDRHLSKYSIFKNMTEDDFYERAEEKNPTKKD